MIEDEMVDNTTKDKNKKTNTQDDSFPQTIDFSQSFTHRVYKKKTILFFVLLLFLILLPLLYFFSVRPPESFPTRSTITIEKGATLIDITKKLKSENVIRSQFLFYSTVIILDGEKSANAGDYYLYEKEGVFSIAYRISSGKFGLTPTVIRIPEGLNNRETALFLSNSINNFDMTKFLSLAKNDEGYLFPDTYHFLPNVSEKEVYKTMKKTFNLRLGEISDEVNNFIKDSGNPAKYSIKDIITMASIIELEASDFKTKQEISGVLWNRIKINMPLQVDASFAYLLGKGTSQLSLEDLEIDSPYNTYKNVGLPPGPISNPSLSSILAAVTPTKSDYLYYLADKNGKTYFSRTFIEHVRKKGVYIK